MAKLFDKILELLEKHLPWFLLGLRLGKSQGQDLRNENTKLKLELKAAKDEKAIRAHNANLSDDALRDEIVRDSARKDDA